MDWTEGINAILWNVNSKVFDSLSRTIGWTVRSSIVVQDVRRIHRCHKGYFVGHHRETNLVPNAIWMTNPSLRRLWSGPAKLT